MPLRRHGRPRPDAPVGIFCVLLGAGCWLWGAAAVPPVVAGDEPAAATPETFHLRYRFQPGEVLRYQVEQQASVRSTIDGTTQTAETLSRSAKVWNVTEVDSEGRATFEHSVEYIDMRQKLTGREEVGYDSRSGQAPPPGFEEAAQSVGVVLSIVTIDPQGTIVSRQDPAKSAAAASSQMTLPLPSEPIRLGHQWSFPEELTVSLPGGSSRQVKARQRFELVEVRDEIAVIEIDTQVLTPNLEPEVLAQVVQRVARGRVRFDLAAGRVIGQELSTDETVTGFSGPASTMHYTNRFSETLATQPSHTARKPPRPRAGPTPPK